MKNILILLAGGEGKRFKQDKAMVLLNGKPLFLHSLEVFLNSKLINEIIIITNSKNQEKIKKIIPKNIKTYNTTGKMRFNSVLTGYKKAKPEDNDLIIFHNSANPFITEEEIQKCLQEAKKHGAAGVAHPATNTIRHTKTGVIDRENLYLMETPQVIRADIFKKGLNNLSRHSEPSTKAYPEPSSLPAQHTCEAKMLGHSERSEESPHQKLAQAPATPTTSLRGFLSSKNPWQSKPTSKHIINPILTDDLAIAEKAGIKPKIIPANPHNFKITLPTDLQKAENILQNAQKKPFLNIFTEIPEIKLNKNLKIGIGHDSHQFDSKGTLTLGGLKFKNHKKLKANSDGDVCLHALTNALLSAISHGSISTIADQMYKNGIKNSEKYLEEALKKLNKAKILNISLSIEAKTPKLEQYFPKIKEKIGKLCKISEKNIGITATSGENLTSFGKGEGVQVFAVVLIEQK